MPHPAPSPNDGPGPWLVLALAIASGVTVANIYYAQPLIGPISQSFGLSLSAAGLIVTMLQLGYMLGLIFLAPLGDLIENKRLILITLGGVAVSLLMSVAAPNAALFIAASLLLGFTAVGTQMIVPVAANLSPDHKRGQIVGTVMSGLLFGILLARPLSTLIAGELGWRGMYLISAAAMAVVIVLMAVALPRRRPRQSLGYWQLIGSLGRLLLSTPVLQRRAAYQALLFADFSLFWTSSPLLLQAPPLSLGHIALSAFLLSGVAGAFIAPLAGRLADHGHSRALTGAAMAAVALSFVLMGLGGAGSLAAMVVAGIVLDAGTQANLVAGQRAIYALPAEFRSRLNALFLALLFFGGALGSALSGFAVSLGGATLVSAIGFSIALIALLLFATEFRRRSAK
ncbi:MAG TPA: MFS transporter [Rhodopseudomonas sp.]|uniref:MFS transporter n=1 Tax=Rhodopseudomonas sp. TaxID=1078 RepID=UPI002ED882DA